MGEGTVARRNLADNRNTPSHLTRPAPTVQFASTVATLASLAAVLLGTAGRADAAVTNVPRMERVATCSWDRPGHNPFMGDVVAAIDRYIDIPTIVRIKLKQRMQARQYDDLVDIRRDEITGRERYEPIIRDMHFGLDRVCRQVSRAGWTAKMHERGLVYCEQGHCILVPTVCRNVSRIERRPTLVAGAPPADPLDAPLGIDPPAAGPDANRSAPRGPTAMSSHAEAVAGADVPGWPTGSGKDGAVGTGIVIGDAGWPGLGPWPGWSMASPDAAYDGPGAADGGGSGQADRSGGSENGGAGGGAGGLPSGGAFPTGDGGLFPADGGVTPGVRGGTTGSDGTAATAVPEPGTWANLLVGGLLLALVSAQRKRRRLPR